MGKVATKDLEHRIKASDMVKRIRELASHGKRFHSEDKKNEINASGRIYKSGYLVIRDYVETDTLSTDRVVEVDYRGERVFYAEVTFLRRRQENPTDKRFDVIMYNEDNRWTEKVMRELRKSQNL